MPPYYKISGSLKSPWFTIVKTGKSDGYYKCNCEFNNKLITIVK